MVNIRSSSILNGHLPYLRALTPLVTELANYPNYFAVPLTGGCSGVYDVGVGKAR